MPLSRLIAILSAVILAAALTVWGLAVLPPAAMPVAIAALVGLSLAVRLLGRR